MVPEYSKLYKNLSYNFRDQDLLIRALTHRSKTRKNYERLEFLGDSILGFMIAEILYLKFPKLEEGRLSQIRSKLVKGQTLAQLALKLGLDNYILLGASEKGGSQKREKILEDVFEAIIGAIYLDSDFATVKKVLLSWYNNVLSNLNLDTVKFKDNKSKLQEILLQNSFDLPEYNIITINGKDHEQVFTVEVIVKELSQRVKAKGSSRRKAEKVAAGEMISILLEKNFMKKNRLNLNGLIIVNKDKGDSSNRVLE